MSSTANPDQSAVAATKCGGCFKPVDPATSVKRTIHPRPTRYSRFSRGSAAPARTEHFCNEACVDRARQDSGHGTRF